MDSKTIDSIFSIISRGKLANPHKDIPYKDRIVSRDILYKHKTEIIDLGNGHVQFLSKKRNIY